MAATGVECERCGGPVDSSGQALEGWPYEWVVATRLREHLREALGLVQEYEGYGFGVSTDDRARDLLDRMKAGTG